MIEDKLDRMIELLEMILNKLNYPCQSWRIYPYWYDPYNPCHTNTEPTYMTTSGTAVNTEAR